MSELFFVEQFLHKIFSTRMSYFLDINVVKSEVLITIFLERVHVLKLRNWFPVSIIFCTSPVSTSTLQNVFLWRTVPELQQMKRFDREKLLSNILVLMWLFQENTIFLVIKTGWGNCSPTENVLNLTLY